MAPKPELTGETLRDARASTLVAAPAALCSLLSSLSQLHPPDLAAHGLRQFRHELDFTRILVGGGNFLAVRLQLASELFARRAVSAQHDERLDDLSAHRVRLSHHRGFQHRRMLDQRALD